MSVSEKLFNKIEKRSINGFRQHMSIGLEEVYDDTHEVPYNNLTHLIYNNEKYEWYTHDQYFVYESSNNIKNHVKNHIISFKLYYRINDNYTEIKLIQKTTQNFDVKLVKSQLAQEPLTIVGELTNQNSRVVRNGDSKYYLMVENSSLFGNGIGAESGCYIFKVWCDYTNKFEFIKIDYEPHATYANSTNISIESTINLQDVSCYWIEVLVDTPKYEPIVVDSTLWMTCYEHGQEEAGGIRALIPHLYDDVNDGFLVEGKYPSNDLLVDYKPENLSVVLWLTRRDYSNDIHSESFEILSDHTIDELQQITNDWVNGNRYGNISEMAFALLYDPYKQAKEQVDELVDVGKHIRDHIIETEMQNGVLVGNLIQFLNSYKY